MHTEPATDPDEMAELAATCWCAIWAKRTRDEECISPEAYYGQDSLTIPPDILPTIPAVAHIEQAITDSGNSCFGPDGIPFAFGDGSVRCWGLNNSTSFSSDSRRNGVSLFSRSGGGTSWSSAVN